jgi:hypothetical protein
LLIGRWTDRIDAGSGPGTSRVGHPLDGYGVTATRPTPRAVPGPRQDIMLG